LFRRLADFSDGLLTGDIKSVTIDSDGWHALVRIKNLGTGGTYATRMGLGTNNDPATGTPLMTFTVTSMGFDDNGDATTIVRTVYGVKPQRKVTPDEATNDETTAGTDVIVKVILSDYIYSKDDVGAGKSGTAVTYSIGSGFYTKTAIPNNASTGTAVNSSTLAYPKVVGNWSYVHDFEHITNASHKLRVAAFHRSAQQGRPVRLVRFTETDGSTTVTTNVTTMTIDADMSADAVPVPEYVATMNSTTLTQGATITRNFKAFPWMGDDAACLDSSTGTAAPTPLVGPLTAVNDRTGAYGTTCALVDATLGNDSTGVAEDISTFDPGTALPFLTIGKAASAIAAYNNTNRSRNDVGAGQVHCKAGSYNWLGSSNSYGSVPACWITIQRAAGVAVDDVILSGTSGNTDISDRVRIKGLKITSNTVNTFSGMLALWFDTCHFDTSGSTLWNTSGSVLWFTHCDVDQLAIGMKPFSTTNQSTKLARGNDLTGFAHTIQVYTVLGNLRTTKYVPSAVLFRQDSIAGSLCPNAVNFIIAYNKIYGWQCNVVEALSVGANNPNTHGGAIVQNLIENTDVATGGLLSIASSDGVTTNTPVDNLLIWHNTFVGQRCFVGYNDAGTIIKERRYWSQKANYWDRWANKGDTFAPTNAARVGAWTVTNRVGASGCVLAQTMISLPGNFFAEYEGIKSYQPTTSSPSTYADFVDLQATTGATGNVAGAGDGDYHTNVTSPLRGMPDVLLLPYDLDGDARSLGDAAGAYTV
jgi:hypothetical protein